MIAGLAWISRFGALPQGPRLNPCCKEVLPKAEFRLQGQPPPQSRSRPRDQSQLRAPPPRKRLLAEETYTEAPANIHAPATNADFFPCIPAHGALGATEWFADRLCERMAVGFPHRPNVLFSSGGVLRRVQPSAATVASRCPRRVRRGIGLSAGGDAQTREGRRGSGRWKESDRNKRYRNKRGRKFRGKFVQILQKTISQICANFAQLRPILHVSAFV